MMIDIISLTFFFFWVCFCLLQTMHDRLVSVFFLRRLMLELGGTFFIAMLKLAAFAILGGGDAV